MPVRKQLWSFASLAFLGFAGWQAMDTLSRTPAFNASLRVETATGASRTRFARTMYSRSEYLNRVALERYLGRDPDLIVEGGATPEELDAIRAEALEIRDILMEGLRINPGDASAWLQLARVESELGNREAALTAYGTSVALAPHNTTLAFDRMFFLLPFMSRPEGLELARATVPVEVVRTDLEAVEMQAFLHRSLKRINESPALAAFLEGRGSDEP